MITIYHGTPYDRNVDKILETGEFIPSDDGLVGSGVYATDNYDLAFGFTVGNGDHDIHSHDRVICITIDDSRVLQLTYPEAAEISGIEKDQDIWQYSVDQLPGVKDFVLNKGYLGVQIIYSDLSEYCIYDQGIIYNISRGGS